MIHALLTAGLIVLGLGIAFVLFIVGCSGDSPPFVWKNGKLKLEDKLQDSYDELHPK